MIFMFIPSSILSSFSFSSYTTAESTVKSELGNRTHRTGAELNTGDTLSLFACASGVSGDTGVLVLKPGKSLAN